VVQVTAFPDNGYLLTNSGASFLATVKAQAAGQTKLELKLDDQVVASQALDLKAGETQIVPLQLDDIKAAGEHTVKIGDWSMKLNVIESASSPARPGTIPQDAQVITENYGLASPGIPGGKLIVTEFGSGPKTLNPATVGETSSSDITNLMHGVGGLIDINPMNAELMPSLAKSWVIAPDGKSVTFQLRHGIKWSDGQPLTADDVVFTFIDTIGNDEVNSNIRDGCTVGGQFVQVEKIDDYTVKASVVEPYRPLLRDCLSANILPKHLLAKSIARLNPGAAGDLQGIQSTVNNNRDDLKKADAKALDALDVALKQLAAAIDAKDAGKVKAATDLVKPALDQLIKAVQPGDLHDALEKAKTYADLAAQSAQAGQFAGIVPGTINNTWNPNTPPDQFAGLGPYVLVSYQTAQQVLLKRNPYYWRVDTHGVQLPYFDEIAVVYVQSIDTQFLYFKSGQSDTFAARPQDWAEILSSAKDKGWRAIKDGPVYGNQFLVLNQDIAKVKPEDPNYQALQYVIRAVEFRQAMSYAINRQAMIDNIYHGIGTPQWTWLSVPSPFYDAESAKTYPYDPQKAAQMLDSLGLIDTNKNGVRNITDKFLIAQNACSDNADCAQKFGAEDKREISFPLATNTGNTIRETLSQQIEHDFKEVGIQATYRPEDFNSLVTELTGGHYGGVVIGFTGGVDPTGFNVWHTNGFYHFWRYSSKDNAPAWEKRAEQLQNEGARIFDVQEAKDKYYKEFEKVDSENLGVIYLANQNFLYAADQCLENGQNFRPQAGNLPEWVAFGDRLWWQRGGDCESKLEQEGRLSAASK
jgi:peptide/nickel transport system substrate-binding protein